MDLRESSSVYTRASWTWCAHGGESGKGFDLLEPIYKCERKLSSSRLSDAGVGQHLKTAVVEQPYIVCVGRFCRWSDVAGSLRGHQSHMFGVSISVHHSRDVLSSLGDILYTGRRTEDGAPWSIESPNGFVTVQGVLFICWWVIIIGKGAGSLRNISRTHVPFLHMPQPSFRPQGYHSLKIWVGYLFPLSGWTYRKSSSPVKDKWITRAMKASKHKDVVLEEDDGDYERGTYSWAFTARLQDRSPGRHCWLVSYRHG